MSRFQVQTGRAGSRPGVQGAGAASCLLNFHLAKCEKFTFTSCTRCLCCCTCTCPFRLLYELGTGRRRAGSGWEGCSFATATYVLLNSSARSLARVGDFETKIISNWIYEAWGFGEAWRAQQHNTTPTTHASHKVFCENVEVDSKRKTQRSREREREN